MQISGLENEFDLARGLPRLLYVKAPAPDRGPRLTDLLSRIEREVSYRVFRTPAELGRLVRDDLAALPSERFATTRTPGTSLTGTPTRAGMGRGPHSARARRFGRGLLVPPVARLSGGQLHRGRDTTVYLLHLPFLVSGVT